MGEFDYDKLSLNYQAVEPKYSFDQVVLSPAVKEKIEEAIGIIEVENKVFDEWGLRAIIPFAASAMSFYGPPGTGKSMAAEAVAHKLGKKILKATYADIESKYHGEGPKMVKAIFRAAERDGAVLFLDESDSLLSKRLTNVSDGSAQAINSMRSQLLISLEQFKGIVIFATNLVVNYDKAFVSRLINIEFTYPTVDEREKIWWNHLRTEQVRVPLAENVNIRHLAENYKFCGRDIKNAVKSACVSTAMQKRNVVTQNDFIGACNRTELEKEQILAANDHTQID
jgi:ATP-dependent 26S proteasome regulatory subunit